ncbi:MAG: peptidoglycan-binding protein [Deltaproteobacteria bacterium]|nr:peptidoglycan-binding protein [Deltaproteobacteria bacterium]
MPAPVGPVVVTPMLQRAVHRAALQRGDNGPEIMILQQALNAHGADVDVTGFFEDETEAAVRAAQTAKGLASTGVVDEALLAALYRAPGDGSIDEPEDPAPRPPPPEPPTPPPAPRPPAPPAGSDWNTYAAIVRRAGGEVCPGGIPTVLGLRQNRRTTRRYDDQFIVLLPSGRVHRFAGATHPSQTRSDQAPDVNGDGVGDVGIIRPGNYQARPNGTHARAASYRVSTIGRSGLIPGWRDTNHDGTYDSSEVARSERRGDNMTGILFHQGNSSAPASIGCLTLAPSVYRSFLSAVGGPSAKFSFTLVEV